MAINKELIDSLIYDFKEAKNRIIMKKKESLSKFHHTIILFFGFTVLPFYLLGVSAEHGTLWYMSIWIVVCVIIGIRQYIRDNIKKETGKKIQSIINAHLEVIQNIGDVQDIEEILKKLNIIKNIILDNFQYLKSQKIKIWHTIHKKEIQLCIAILSDLRSDLNIRIKEQSKILKSAKSEVSENIKGTTELDQVSELQKIRLDKQIEQFEELQRVLVKI